jgi:uncharacterized protein YyaL (SSP411 family)
MSATPNRLIHESSLYLRQHARNPVDWYPWGPEALARARDLDRPIFLSIGYSACHWCHVMEHESFEDEATAELLNRHFVPIKVDREERPDLDTIYMTALQAMTQEGGGWPLSVWLTPDLHPFYAGTYFPPSNRYGRPGFRTLLEAIAEAWKTRRDDITQQSAEVVRFLNQNQPAGGARELRPELLSNSARALQRIFDPRYGGFGRAPKFPHPMEIRLLLRVWKRFGDDTALHMVRHTLDRMAAGGIYDQMGGGFHRYSTDERWLVPHFEKMLYDNALLASAYVEAWQATGDPEYRRVASETLDYVLREMTDPAGAFYSTQDADCEGEEGKFYVWTRAEVEGVLGAEDARLFFAAYDITDAGNWEGHNIPNRPRTWPEVARSLGVPEDELRRRCREMADRLYQARAKRVWPGRDEKVLTAWNGLMIAAFAQAGAAFDEPRYIAAAVRAADFVLANLRRPDGRLFRTTAVGSAPKLDAYLEDYAYLIEALTRLYEATFEAKWVESAVGLADLMVRDFHDVANGGFFYTAIGHEPLITRTKDSHDGSTPSGNAMAATALLRLSAFTGRHDFRDLGDKTLNSFAGLMAEAPAASGQMLNALDFSLGPAKEIAVIGRSDGEPVRSVLGAIRRRFLPNAIVAAHDPGSGPPPASIPLLHDRPALGDVTTYVCENFTCQQPLVGAESGARAVESL